MPVYFGYGYGLPKVVKRLLIANAAVFVVTFLLPGSMQILINSVFGLKPILINNFPPFIWQFFTYQYLHGGFGHILMNMFVLWMFGTELEYNWGARDFFQYYTICGVGGGLLVWMTSFFGFSDPGVTTIGASGAIFGLLVAYGMMWPDRIVYVFGVLPMKAIVFVIIIGSIEVLNAFGRAGGGVAYFAHVGGGLTGLVYLKYGWRIWVHLESVGRQFKRRKFTVVDGGKSKSSSWEPETNRHKEQPGTPHPDLDEEINRILDKIAREGMESLTDNERNVLDRASNRRRR